MSIFGLLLTAVATCGIATTVLAPVQTVAQLLAGVLFLTLVGALLWGNIAHQVSRLGFHLRRRNDLRPPDLDALFDGTDRQLLLLVPSYREEVTVIRQTLVAAGLQAYPGTEVILLVDDPPAPSDPAARQQLDAACALPAELTAWLAHPRDLVHDAHVQFLCAEASATGDLRREVERLAATMQQAAEWLLQQADDTPVVTHTDAVFTAQVLCEPARRLQDRADALVVRGDVDWRELHQGYRRLFATFSASFSWFQRKRFLNLSHEPNKAMNLNAYLGLLGGRWREEARGDGLHLVPAGPHDGTLVVPECPYVVTLDADSIIDGDYAATLIEWAERPDNHDIAVLQTPYSAIPHAPGLLERIAGATTDMQYVAHQGFNRFGAAFWVGANALIRTKALLDIERTTVERGHTVRQFISDRTVIEDTESSLDLAAKGWRIHNHLARLSFSATPPDFGSLVIQRRRWANGGLILVPRLVDVARAGRGSVIGLFLRGHYLLSITATNVSLVVLLYGGFGEAFSSWWLPLSALPYFAIYARDLRQAGYRHRDVVAVYALNLLLVPTNLAGVLKSVEQVVRRSKTPFARTPKVEGRTPAPRKYHLWVLAMIGFAVFASAWDIAAGNHAHAVYSLSNAALLVWAVTAFIGWGDLRQDLAPSRRATPATWTIGWPTPRQVPSTSVRRWLDGPELPPPASGRGSCPHRMTPRAILNAAFEPPRRRPSHLRGSRRKSHNTTTDRSRDVRRRPFRVTVGRHR